MVIQLDLFGSNPVALSFESAQDYNGAAMRAGILDDLLNPCKNCELRDFCGSDDCGMHLFDLDVNEPETEPEDEDEDFEVVVDPYWNR